MVWSKTVILPSVWSMKKTRPIRCSCNSSDSSDGGLKIMSVKM